MIRKQVILPEDVLEGGCSVESFSSRSFQDAVRTAVSVRATTAPGALSVSDSSVSITSTGSRFRRPERRMELPERLSRSSALHLNPQGGRKQHLHLQPRHTYLWGTMLHSSCRFHPTVPLCAVGYRSHMWRRYQFANRHLNLFHDGGIIWICFMSEE